VLEVVQYIVIISCISYYVIKKAVISHCLYLGFKHVIGAHMPGSSMLQKQLLLYDICICATLVTCCAAPLLPEQGREADRAPLGGV
jgi:hypothetical protein